MEDTDLLKSIELYREDPSDALQRMMPEGPSRKNSSALNQFAKPIH